MDSLYELIRERAAGHPTAPAILAPGRQPLTYGALLGQVEAGVAALRERGIGRDDRVALAIPPGPEAAVATLAVACGAICAPLNPAGPTPEQEARLARLNCRALLVSRVEAPGAVAAAAARGIPVLEIHPVSNGAAGSMALVGDTPWPPAGRPDGARPESKALLLQTSGTGETPKLVLLSHANLCAAAGEIARAVALNESDRCLGILPLFHIHGLSAVLASLAGGGSVVCPGGFSPDGFFQCLETFQPTWYTASPAIHRAIVESSRRHAATVKGVRLRFIRSASSALPPVLADQLEGLFRAPVIEAYGMTEASPQIASNRLPPARRKPGSVGRPAGPSVRIADTSGRPVPAGQTGEILIRGPSVIEAYADSAGPDRFIDGWLRTGDLGHQDADGDLFVTGRAKEIINRGGEKVWPREVEDVLLEHAAVADAVVFAVPHPALGEGVGAAVVLRPGARITEAGLRRYVASRLAAFKAPQRIVMVDRIPLGPTGKPERGRLAARLGLGNSGDAWDFVPTGESIEQRLAGIWGEVLGLAAPGMHQDFFHLGGHSLSAMQVLARVRREFGVELDHDVLFDRPTIAGLAALVRESGAIPGDAEGVRTAAPSFAQERLWFLEQLEPGKAAYHIDSPLRLSGRLDYAALERALNELRRRHETLRTAFAESAGRPVQRIAPPRDIPLSVTDLAALPPEAREAEAGRLAAAEAARPFDLASGPLFRASLIRLSAEEHLLLLVLHHLVSDGWSTGVLHGELRALYGASAAQRPSPLPELPWQYAEFAAWQRKHLDGPVLDRQLEYWKRQLAHLPPPLELMTDRPRPAVPSFRGSRTTRVIPAETTEALAGLGRREGATPFMILLAAFQMLLARHTGQEDIVVGAPTAGRTRVETEPMIGFFANTLVLRGDLSGDPPFREWLARVKTMARGAYAHQDLPFDKLVDALRPGRLAGANPLFRVMFAFQNVPDAGTQPFDLAPGLSARPFRTESGSAKFDLTVYLWESGREIRTTWQYNTDLFEEATISRLASQFATLLAGIAADPDRRISGYPLLSDPERRQTVESWSSGTGVDPGGDSFPVLFEERVREAPDAVAVEFEGGRLTYGELNARANRLARLLQDQGVGPDEIVALRLPRSGELVVAILGVLKARGAYLVLDPDYPPERLAFMLEDARPRLVLAEPGDLAESARFDAANLDVAASGGSLAYLIYTSGSTGRPKGVAVTHANLGHCARAMGAALGIGRGDRYLHTASFGFSSSVRQFAVPLAHGATVVLASRDRLRDPLALFTLVRDRHVSVADLVPSYWRACLREIAALGSAESRALLDNRLRLILSASERLTPDLPREWAKLGPGARLVNMYGQTETTGIVSIQEIGPEAATIPIGRPIANTRLYVLDRTGAPVPPGVPGELQVAGAGLARGYWNQPGLTAERFLPDPFHAGQRMFRTGDVARYRPDGTLEFLGRTDDQLKVRGQRIEPGEVEAILREHGRVRDCAVVLAAQFDPPRLVAFAAADGDPADLPGELRAMLKRRLPEAMLPHAITVVDVLPRTPTGKVDRRALALGSITERPAPPTPATGAEALLAGIWRDLLQVERVGSGDNFFDLGGDSLLSVQMIRRANQAGLPVSLRDFFQSQTVAGLARVAAAQDASSLAPVPAAGEQPVHVTLESLRAYGREALEKAGLDPEGAAIVTEVQLEASLRGQPTHNMDSIPRYARRLLAGRLNPRPVLRVEQESRISARIDGDNGPGQWVATVAMQTAIAKARQGGIGVVSVRRSNHFGAAGHYVWLAAQAGLIGLCTTNGPAILAPTGGTTPVFGNNPIAAAIPAGRHRPIILDIALSVAPRGRIGLQLAEGRPLPPGWILDARGRPSIDPADLAAGLGVPIGGHKGYGLALVMEVLAGVLPGAGFGLDHSRPRLKDPGVLPDVGHFFIAIDPGLFSPAAEFSARVDRLIEQAKSASRQEGIDEILIPGEAELRARERHLHAGVPLRPVTFQALLAHAATQGLAAKLQRISPAQGGG